MKERPILFSGPMVRAILDGRKTETRRLVNPQPTPETVGYSYCIESSDRKRDGAFIPRLNDRHECGPPVRCPFGSPGDRLWVRETWSVDQMFDMWKPRNVPQSDPRRGMSPCPQFVWYSADTRPTDYGEGKKRPSIHMPRWASRLALEVLEVRVERLQGITEDGARAEGHDPSPQPATINGEPGKVAVFDPVKWLAVEWDKLNGKRDGASWTANPWVWVVSFQAAASNAVS